MQSWVYLSRFLSLLFFCRKKRTKTLPVEKREPKERSRAKYKLIGAVHTQKKRYPQKNQKLICSCRNCIQMYLGLHVYNSSNLGVLVAISFTKSLLFCSYVFEPKLWIYCGILCVDSDKWIQRHRQIPAHLLNPSCVSTSYFVWPAVSFLDTWGNSFFARGWN